MTPVSPGVPAAETSSGSNNVAHFSAGPNSDLRASRLTESLWCSDSAWRRRRGQLPLRIEEGFFRSRSSQLSIFYLLQCGLLEGQPDWRVVAILEIRPLDHHD